MFGLREKKVKINEEVYTIRPLKGEDLDKFYKTIEKLEPMMQENQDEKDAIKNLDPEAMGLLHYLVTKTLLRSYPDMNREGKRDELEEFVTQNLFKFIEPLMTVNLPEEQNNKG